MSLSSDAWSAERFPPPDFESGYELPSMTRPLRRVARREFVAVAVLAGALCLASWLALVKRSRRAIVLLSLFCLAYFGFYRGGCVCPVGSVQNVSLSMADPGYALPLTVGLFFILPLVFGLLFGRVFCGAVCPLGAIQDVVLLRPVRVPAWLEHVLRVLPFVYLGAAVLFAATHTMFIICRYDPFVSFFRLSGEFHMLVIGGGVLFVAMFVGRPYCRFLCPYGALLAIVSRFAWRRVSTTPDECAACSLCENACPFGAITPPTPEGVSQQL